MLDQKTTPPPPYPAEFRRPLIELVRAGQSPEALARKFEPTAQTIRNWVRQADLDEGKRMEGLTSEERLESPRSTTTMYRITLLRPAS